MANSSSETLMAGALADHHFLTLFDLKRKLAREPLTVIFNVLVQTLPEQEVRRIISTGIKLLCQTSQNYTLMTKIIQGFPTNTSTTASSLPTVNPTDTHTVPTEPETTSTACTRVKRVKKKQQRKGRKKSACNPKSFIICKKAFAVQSITCKIFTFLDFTSLTRCSRVNMAWLYDSYQPASIHRLDTSDPHVTEPVEHLALPPAPPKRNRRQAQQFAADAAAAEEEAEIPDVTPAWPVPQEPPATLLERSFAPTTHILRFKNALALSAHPWIPEFHLYFAQLERFSRLQQVEILPMEAPRLSLPTASVYRPSDGDFMASNRQILYESEKQFDPSFATVVSSVLRSNSGSIERLYVAGNYCFYKSFLLDPVLTGIVCKKEVLGAFVSLRELRIDAVTLRNIVIPCGLKRLEIVGCILTSGFWNDLVQVEPSLLNLDELVFRSNCVHTSDVKKLYKVFKKLKRTFVARGLKRLECGLSPQMSWLTDNVLHNLTPLGQIFSSFLKSFGPGVEEVQVETHFKDFLPQGKETSGNAKKTGNNGEFEFTNLKKCEIILDSDLEPFQVSNVLKIVSFERRALRLREAENGMDDSKIEESAGPSDDACDNLGVTRMSRVERLVITEAASVEVLELMSELESVCFERLEYLKIDRFKRVSDFEELVQSMRAMQKFHESVEKRTGKPLILETKLKFVSKKMWDAAGHGKGSNVVNTEQQNKHAKEFIQVLDQWCRNGNYHVKIECFYLEGWMQYLSQKVVNWSETMWRFDNLDVFHDAEECALSIEFVKLGLFC